MRISDWSSDVCSSDLVALRCCPAQYLDLAGVKAEPFVNARDLRLAGALVGQKDPRWAALDDRRGDRTGLDIGEALRGEHHARILLAQRRSEARRVGKECVSTCRSRWSPCH